MKFTSKVRIPITFYLKFITVCVLVYFIKQFFSAKRVTVVGREPWSSCYGKRLTFWRSWVWILVPYTWWTFFTFICCKNCYDVCLKRPKINEKESGFGPFFLKKNNSMGTSSFTSFFFLLAHRRGLVFLQTSEPKLAPSLAVLLWTSSTNLRLHRWTARASISTSPLKRHSRMGHTCWYKVSPE